MDGATKRETVACSDVGGQILRVQIFQANKVKLRIKFETGKVR